MFVCCECCVLSVRGICDELITRPEESYRLWCVVVCDLKNLKNEEVMTRVEAQRHRERIKLFFARFPGFTFRLAGDSNMELKMIMEHRWIYFERVTKNC